MMTLYERRYYIVHWWYALVTLLGVKLLVGLSSNSKGVQCKGVTRSFYFVGLGDSKIAAALPSTALVLTVQPPPFARCIAIVLKPPGAYDDTVRKEVLYCALVVCFGETSGSENACSIILE